MIACLPNTLWFSLACVSSGELLGAELLSRFADGEGGVQRLSREDTRAAAMRAAFLSRFTGRRCTVSSSRTGKHTWKTVRESPIAAVVAEDIEHLVVERDDDLFAVHSLCLHSAYRLPRLLNLTFPIPTTSSQENLRTHSTVESRNSGGEKPYSTDNPGTTASKLKTQIKTNIPFAHTTPLSVKHALKERRQLEATSAAISGGASIGPISHGSSTQPQPMIA